MRDRLRPIGWLRPGTIGKLPCCVLIPINRLPRRDLSREERDAIDALRGQLVEIRTIKAAHARKPE